MPMERRNRLAVALAANDQERAIFMAYWNGLTLQEKADLEDCIIALWENTRPGTLQRWLIFMGSLALQEHEAAQLAEADDEP